MQEMFEASVDGEAYDMDRFGQYFRPAGMSARTGDPTKPASTSATATSQSAPTPTPTPEPEAAPAAPVAEAAPAATTAEAAPATGGDAQDILSMIRARQSQ
jgi:hypothetical protein